MVTLSDYFLSKRVYVVHKFFAEAIIKNKSVINISEKQRNGNMLRNTSQNRESFHGKNNCDENISYD